MSSPVSVKVSVGRSHKSRRIRNKVILKIQKSAAGQTVEDCDINVEVTKTTTYNTILNFGPYNPYFAAFMRYVLRRTFEKIFSNIRDSSNGAFDFGAVTVTDIKAQQDPSCNTGTWCTEMNLAISVRVSEFVFMINNVSQA